MRVPLPGADPLQGVRIHVAHESRRLRPLDYYRVAEPEDSIRTSDRLAELFGCRWDNFSPAMLSTSSRYFLRRFPSALYAVFRAATYR